MIPGLKHVQFISETQHIGLVTLDFKLFIALKNPLGVNIIPLSSFSLIIIIFSSQGGNGE